MLFIFHNPEATVVIAMTLLLAPVPEAMTANPINSFMKFLNEGTNQYDQEPEDQQRMFKEYDFIIVGAGTAGATIANRLSEIPEWQILLVEAGSKENYLMDIPILANYLQFTDSNWGYKTMPSDTACLGFNGKQCNWPRGKVMGGSSVLNYMIYTRGNKRDYDQWYEMGNEGWSWKDVLPFFKKVENYNIPEFNDPRYHKKGGYVNIEEVPFKTPVANAWVKGAQEAGHTYGDYNGEYQTRVSYLQVSMKNGTRHSASRAYLHPVYKRKNLHVTKMSMVTKIIIDPYMKTVSGIVLEKYNRKYKVYVRKEVILCAGAINSPQLLMLSGIGPRDHLESLGIPTLVDLKVGFNLMDHIAPGGLTYLTHKQNITLQFQYIMNNPARIFEWMEKHDGPLSVPGGCEALVFIDLNNRTLNDGWANMELLMISGGLNNDPLLRYNFGFRNGIFDRVFGPLADKPAHMIFPMLMRPKSKGRVMLKNRNPKSYPLLYPNYLTHPDDIRTVVEGIKASIEISKQPTMKKIGTKIYSNPIKECLQYGPFGSDEYWACHARMFTFTIYHQSGTCKMGPAKDPSAVVDPRLRVHGIQGLRVMDASIMPEIPSAHTNAPTFMIAEKGSNIVKEDWGKLGRFKRSENFKCSDK